jgi:hypothetical protein
MNLHESMTQFPTGKIATDVYTIDIVIALLNTVCFVNISIPKAKDICEEFKFVLESIMTLRDL